MDIYIYMWQVRRNGMGDGSEIMEYLNSSGGILCNVGVTVKSTAVGVDCVGVGCMCHIVIYC